ncbi:MULTISPECIES: sigma-E factor negative regulatory protein [unclassified Modicisalibacter]|uniref:sigma-E factor negative regulatory protein n=1 Tax=unclassified Modicisalibacter TaxID=2679913 RepID=UPI001CC95E7A|nr:MULTISPECIES: sigma-E factor negative regulatory protein [unclassified Modicisalibacter]MBZ9556585.1 sigma-E factor negative regulatory protein [Modicisalibacter sp. R2A 31.J]MBZ9574946.1 sigma-E factor negative regulatory protein [Modicisalibacter sp. MOD 31.J]
MNDNLRESLSALMDNEGDELELRRVLKSLDESPGDADVWRRYHLARSLMARDRDVDVSADLSAGIMARIEAEPRPRVADEPVARRGGLSFAGSAAVAATVSLMVITGVQVYNGSSPVTSPDMSTRTTSSSGGAGAAAPGMAANETRSRASGGAELVDLPQYPAFSPGALSAGNNGLMTVGAGFESPMFMAPGAQSTQAGDLEQAQLLQRYLDRHAQGAAYRSGETWMPLLRASAQESLGGH